MKRQSPSILVGLIMLISFSTTFGRQAPLTVQGGTKGLIDPAQQTCPPGARQLVGKTGYDLVPESDVPCQWTFKDGVLTASPSWDSVITRRPYRDFRMHVEFNVNEVPGVDPEKNGNSGIYIQQRYEVQILNSFAGPLRGNHAFDSDIHKALEGALYCLEHYDNKVLADRVENIIDRLVAAQQPDGFLISCFIVKDQDQRWENLRMQHQTYNAGHFFEMAVAHHQLTGDSSW